MDRDLGGFGGISGPHNLAIGPIDRAFGGSEPLTGPIDRDLGGLAGISGPHNRLTRPMDPDFRSSDPPKVLGTEHQDPGTTH